VLIVKVKSLLKKAAILYLISVVICILLIMIFDYKLLLHNDIYYSFLWTILYLSIGVEVLALIYFSYISCYKNRCYKATHYYHKELASLKSYPLMIKIILVPLIYFILFFLPFIMTFLLAIISVLTYLCIYILFIGKSLTQTMYMEYDTSTYRSSTFAVATPHKQYQLFGSLDALGFSLKDEGKTPYVIYGHLKEGNTYKTIYARKAYLYQIEGKKTRFGYIITHYKRLYHYEYTKKELNDFNCTIQLGIL